MFSSDDRTDAAVFDALLTVSTLRAAAAVRHDADERRAGRDPSAQEREAVVRPYLLGACEELQEGAHRLRAAFAYARHVGDGPTAALVRRFDALLTLRGLHDALGTVHRRLLSLYPAIDAALVEAARTLHGESGVLLEASDHDALDARAEAHVEALVEAVLRLAVGLEATLRGA